MKSAIWVAVILIARQSYARDECASHHQECPAWFTPHTTSTNGTVCKCDNSISDIVQCSEHSNQSSLWTSYCMTYSCEHHSTYIGMYPFNSRNGFFRQRYVHLPAEVSEVNDFICGGLNRTGLLCSRCMDGLGVATLSYGPYCLECLSSLQGWALYTFLILFPLTLFLIAFMFFQIKVTSAEMNVFLFLSHLISININQAPSYNIAGAFQLLLITFYGFWNLDFFRYVIPRFCASEGLTQIQVLALDYIPALYPLLLIVLTYVFIELHDRDCRVFVWLWRPFNECFTRVKTLRNSNPKASVIHAFAAFLLLSYSKLLLVSFNLLNFTTVYNTTGNQSGPRRVYHNATIPYLSSEHIPFFILAICILVVFVVPFTLLLFLYPMRWFQRCIGCSGRGWHALHAFADVFHGCYKNGTNGTRDYRYFAGLYLILRIGVNLIITFMPYRYIFAIGSIITVTVSLSFALLRPYSNNWFNVLDSLSFFLFSLSLQFTVYNLYVFPVTDIVFSFILTLPFLYFIIYSAYRVTLYTGVHKRCTCCQRFSCLNDRQTDTEHGEYVLPDRIDNPRHYMGAHWTRRASASESNQLQSPVRRVPTYGSIH